MRRTDKLLEQFDERYDNLQGCAGKLCDLIGDILNANGQRVHSINARVKQRASLQQKLERPDANYEVLSEVTDLIGIRIITYFDTDVDQVARCVADDFTLDEDYSVDKREIQASDRFGYLSLHYVASLSERRERLAEYRIFAGVQFEIQIRSILQHAWAEIEHDMGYKSEQAVPKEIRRRFFRLAGLLEIADAEFSRIRQDLSAYEEVVESRVRALDSGAPTEEAVAIDKVTLQEFYEASMLAKDLDTRCASDALARSTMNEPFFSRLPALLAAVGIHDLGTLRAQLSLHRDAVLRLSKSFSLGNRRNTMSIGVSSMFLSYVVVWLEKGDEGLGAFMDTFRIEMVPEQRKRFFDKVRSAVVVAA